MQSIALTRAAWSYLAKAGPLYLARKGGEFLCEGPYERLDLGGTESSTANDTTESCVRVFLTREACEAYCVIWRELLGVEPSNQGVRPMPVALNTLWSHINSIVSNSYFNYQVPCRIDICKIQAGEYPVHIDTIFSELEEMN